MALTLTMCRTTSTPVSQSSSQRNLMSPSRSSSQRLSERSSTGPLSPSRTRMTGNFKWELYRHMHSWWLHLQSPFSNSPSPGLGIRHLLHGVSQLLFIHSLCFAFTGCIKAYISSFQAGVTGRRTWMIDRIGSPRIRIQDLDS
jgi:hypothetical protein